ncbi:MAG: ABC transporter permease [Opitutae bacterium]
MSELALDTPAPATLWQRFTQKSLPLIALGFLVILATVCFLSPWISPYDYKSQNLLLGPTSPSAEHWFGTDLLGRDLLSRVLQGGLISITVGLIATLVALLVGVIYGIMAAELGGRFEDLSMRVIDIISTLPLTLIVVLCTVVFGQNIWLIFLAVGGVSWLTMARIICTKTRQLKSRQFVDASVALGQSRLGIIFNHYLPNLSGTIAVYTTLTIPNVLMLEAFVSFLGLGVKAPMTSWGLLIKEGTDVMEQCPWLLIIPATTFALSLLSLSYLGDGLRDAFDPRSNKN